MEKWPHFCDRHGVFHQKNLSTNTWTPRFDRISWLVINSSSSISRTLLHSDIQRTMAFPSLTVVHFELSDILEASSFPVPNVRLTLVDVVSFFAWDSPTETVSKSRGEGRRERQVARAQGLPRKTRANCPQGFWGRLGCFFPQNPCRR